jgi:hypothetical protein
MSKTKLEKVLEHLLNNQEGQAKALLHQIFIEKARAIHEDLMTQEEGDEFGMDGSGSDEDDFLDATKRHDSGISNDEDEIEFEEIMSEEEDDMATDDDDMADVVDDQAGEDDMDSEDDMDDMGGQDDMGSEAGEMQGMEKGIDALSKALQDLQTEFDRLQGHEAGEEQAGEEGEDDMDFGDEEGGDDVMDGEEGEEGEVEEDWLHEEEDWEDLEEGLKLDVVTADMLNQQKTPGEVGNGPKFAGDVGRGVKSPLPASQKDRMGAGPVTMGKGAEKSGYERESAPSSATLKHTQGDNRRSKATQNMTPVSKEGAAGALLNKSTEGNKRSPLSRAPAK